MLSRSAIQASGIVVLERNSPASFTFLRSPLRRALSSAWVHPIRFKHSTTQRSARASCASCAASPKWLRPGPPAHPLQQLLPKLLVGAVGA